MKKTLTIALTALLAMGSLYAQQPTQKAKQQPHPQHQHQQQHGGQHCGNCPHHKQHAKQQATVNADGIAFEVVRAFPKAKSVKKTTQWTEVYNADKQLLGYALYSKPASDGIKGYLGETPLLIALDANKKVLSVEMLKNSETPSYVKMVKDAGLLKQWNGMSVKKAKKKKVDTVSGATYTSKSVILSFQAALKNIK